MNEIKFTYNWNNKLDNKYFTTIRLYSVGKFKIGEEYDILVKNKKEYHKIYSAILVAGLKYKLDDIPLFLFAQDTGYDKEASIKIVETMYKNSNIDIHNALFAILLFKRI